MGIGVRRIVTVLAALLLGLAWGLRLLPFTSPWAADAFDPRLHIAMFEQALQEKFDSAGREWVEDGLTRSDNEEGQGHPEWHFDSANTPAAICKLWKAGPDALLKEAEQEAVEAFRIVPTDPPGFDRVGPHRAEALRFYGQYLHAIQDFYAHTNWIELHLDSTKPHTLRTIPIPARVQKGCYAAARTALQTRLQSGFFAFNAANRFATVVSGAPDFCGPVTVQGPNGPVPAPRPPRDSGFRYCHGPPHPDTIREILRGIPRFMVAFVNQQAGRDVTVSTLAPELMLAKDLPDRYHGSERLRRPDGTVTTYHAEARRLATEATSETFDVLHDRMVARLKADLPDRNPECLFQVLVQGGDPACPEGLHYVGSMATLSSREKEGSDFTVEAFEVEIFADPETGEITGGDWHFVLLDTETNESGAEVPVRVEYTAATTHGQLPREPITSSLGSVTFTGELTVTGQGISRRERDVEASLYLAYTATSTGTSLVSLMMCDPLEGDPPTYDQCIHGTAIAELIDTV